MKKMIAVKIFWNTHPDGEKVNHETVDWTQRDAPISIYGPFDNITDAISWMENDYPDGDTDVFDMTADEYEFPDDYFINDPKSIFPDEPDEDIRDDSQEIQGP